MKRLLFFIFVLLGSLTVKGQTFTFECICDYVTAADSNCDICNTNIQSRLFKGILIRKNATAFKWIDQPYIVQFQGNNATFKELIPNGEVITITLAGTPFDSIPQYQDSIKCPCAGSDNFFIAGPGIYFSGDTISAFDVSPINELQFVDSFYISAGNLYVSLDRDSVAASVVTLPVPTGAETIVTAGTGISVSGVGTSGSPYVVTNTAPDQTVSITGAGINVVTGTYPTFTITGTEVGTVASVGLALPTSVFDISGSPVTSSGTLTATFDNQSANTVFAGPTTGGAATPTFRALVAADITGGGGVAGTGVVNQVAFFSPNTTTITTEAGSGLNALTWNPTTNRLAVATTTTTGGVFTVGKSTGDNINMGESEIQFLGSGIANNSILNNYSGVKGLYLGNTDATSAIGGTFTPMLKVAGTSESEFYQKLKVPTFQMTTGAAAGYVFQSDASGNATWVQQWTKDGAVAGLWTNVVPVTVGGTTGSRLVVRNNESSTSAASSGNYDGIIMRNQDATNNNWISISGYSQGGAIAADMAFQVINHASAYSDIVFHTRGSSTSFGEAARITSEKLLGIRTAVPTRDLDVNGEVRIRDLTTTTGTTLVLADGTGVLSAGGLSGMSIVSGTLTATDGSVTNELQTLSNTSTSTTHVATLSNSGGSLTLSEGSGITIATTGTTLDGIATITATDPSLTNEAQTLTISGTTTGVITLNQISGVGGGTATIAAGTGITVGQSGGTITITNSSPASGGWLLNGNTITTAKRIGSNDNFDVVVETNGTDRLFFDNAGTMSLGATQLTTAAFNISGLQNNIGMHVAGGTGLSNPVLLQTRGNGSGSNCTVLDAQHSFLNGNVEALIQNTSTSGTGGALLTLNVHQSATGDAKVVYTTNGTTYWAHGIDNSASGEPWRLTDNSDIGSGTSTITANISNQVGINQNTPTVTLQATGTDGIGFPQGTTAQRPVTPAFPVLRWNSTFSGFEVWDPNKSYWYRLTAVSTPTVVSNTSAGTGHSGNTLAGELSSDVRGVLELNTGSASTAVGTVMTVTYASAYSGTKTVVMLDAGNDIAATQKARWRIDTQSNTGFTIRAVTALDINKTYVFKYYVGQ